MRGARVWGPAAEAGPGMLRRDHRRSAIMTHVTRFYYFNGPPRRAAAHATRILIGRFRAGIILSFRPSHPRLPVALSCVKRDEHAGFVTRRRLLITASLIEPP